MTGTDDAREEARKLLLGAWEVVAFEDRDTETDPWTQTFGPDPKGIIVYDSSGTVSVHVPPAGNVAEYVGYYGRFEVVEAVLEGERTSGVVEHRMESATTPWLMEEAPARDFEVSPDRLILGDQRTSRRVLDRRPPRD